MTPMHLQSNARGWIASYLYFIFGRHVEPQSSEDMDMVSAENPGLNRTSDFEAPVSAVA